MENIKDCLFIASSNGVLCDVEKCLRFIRESTNSNSTYDDILDILFVNLCIATENNRIGVIKYVLNFMKINNFILKSSQYFELVLLFSKLGYSQYLSHIITSQKCHSNLEICLENCLKLSVENGHTKCVEYLLNIHRSKKIDFLLSIACRKNFVNIINILCDNGADVNCRNGEILSEACERGNLPVVEELIKLGVDVSIDDDKSLRTAVVHNEVNVAVKLLEAGANYEILQKTPFNETTLTLIEAFSKQYKLKKLCCAIFDSFNKFDFKWQAVCAVPSNLPDSLIFSQAEEFSVETLDKSKRVLCAELAELFERKFNIKKMYDAEYTDFSGTIINDLPEWQIMEIEGIPFNCFDLFKLLRQKVTLNPYTKNELPISLILKKQAFLRKVLTKERFKNEDLLQKVRETPVASELSIIRERLESDVWDKLLYPPSHTIFTEADDGEIDEMVKKLYRLCHTLFLSDNIFSISNTNIPNHSLSNIYPMVTIQSINDIYKVKGRQKKMFFINLLNNIVNTVDIHQETRKLTVVILFKHFDTLKRRLGIGPEGYISEYDDDLEFMFDDDEEYEGNEDDEIDFDLYEFYPNFLRTELNIATYYARLYETF